LPWNLDLGRCYRIVVDGGRYEFQAQIQVKEVEEEEKI